MNLFIIGWKIPQDIRLRLMNECAGMCNVYPQLDSSTLWNKSSDDGQVTVSSMHTGNIAAAPRRYVDIQKDSVVLFSGLPINPDGSFAAHRAEDLTANWDRLGKDLEGMYSLVRINTTINCLEVQTDILGMEQVFYSQKGDFWIISNSVRLIENLIGLQPLDMAGVSTFLSMGWVAREDTLRSGIKTIPGGEKWIWNNGATEPQRISYYSPTKLAHLPKQKLTQHVVEDLASDMKQHLAILNKHFSGDISCPLTGGRDSRLLAALLSEAGVEARYYTYGESSGQDAEIAAQVANILNLNYEIKQVTKTNINNRWDEICSYIVKQSDGMYPLQLMAGVLAFLNIQLDRLDIRIWGVGGEIARGFYNNASFYLKRRKLAEVKHMLANRRATNRGDLLSNQSVDIARNYINQFAEKTISDGFLPTDIPDVLYTYERVGSRGGKNMRMSMAIRDAFSPFCTRSFVETTFSLNAAQRYTEPLHYQLIRHLNPELHQLPFDKDHWRLQNRILNLLNKYGKEKITDIENKFKRKLKIKKENLPFIARDTMFDRKGWFEDNRDKIREICLDQSESLLWDSVDRLKFDRLTSTKTKAAVRSRYLDGLYPIATLFYYEVDRSLIPPKKHTSTEAIT